MFPVLFGCQEYCAHGALDTAVFIQEWMQCRLKAACFYCFVALFSSFQLFYSTQNLRYADDTTLIAESEELESFLMKVKEKSERA